MRAKPTLPKAGPMARTITRFESSPVMMKPPMRTFSPVRMLSRVEIFCNLLPKARENSEVSPSGAIAVAVKPFGDRRSRK